MFNLHWFIFSIVVITLLVLDLGVFNKKDEVISYKNSFLLTIFYITCAVIFGIYIYYDLGSHSAKEYFTGYVLEKAMSLDNIFIISMIFKFFGIPRKYQHRVLFYGILGVIIFRGIMILIGAAIIARFEWVLLIFGIILIATGIKTFYLSDKKLIVEEMLIYQKIQKIFNISHKIQNHNFFLIKNNQLFITPLFVALIIIETMDVIFAVDSIPAIFAITRDPYIVYTSNIFAVLGLRALFFFLENVIHRFKYVKYSLAIILIMIGLKIFVDYFIEIPKIIPLILTLIILSVGILISLILENHNKSLL